MRAAIYARASAADGRQDVDNQIAGLRRFIETQGLVFNREMVVELREQGKSGREIARVCRVVATTVRRAHKGRGRTGEARQNPVKDFGGVLVESLPSSRCPPCGRLGRAERYVALSAPKLRALPAESDSSTGIDGLTPWGCGRAWSA